MNEDAADALLKDLEEPPAYAVIVLVADEHRTDAGDDPFPLPAVPFRRLSERAVARRSRRARPGSARTSDRDRAAGRRDGSTAPSGCSTPTAAVRPRRCSRGARASTSTTVRADRRRERAARDATRCGGAGEGARGGEGAGRSSCRSARRSSACGVRSGVRSARSCSRRSRSSRRGTATWSRSPSAPTRAVVHVDRLDDLRADAARERMLGAERARRGRARDVARARGVQPGAGALARGAVRPARARAALLT